jgi:hypothetical protein
VPFPPGWNSVEEVSKIHKFFEIAGIACLLALGVAEIVAFLYGHRKEHLMEVQAQELQSDLDRLKRESLPRTLSEQQKQILLANLKAGGTYELTVRHSPTLESQEFAAQLSAILVAAGWKINPHPPFRYITNDAAGVFIVVNKIDAPPEGANVLQGALEAIGISAAGVGSDSTAEGTFELYVGQKDAPVKQ